MRAMILAMTLAMLLVSSLAMAAEPWEGRVERVVDGDTLDVAGPDGAPVCVRLYAIDAPELDQPDGKKAAGELQTWITNLGSGIVQVTPVSQDQHGCTVARVEAGHFDLGRPLTELCLAWVDHRSCRGDCPLEYTGNSKKCHDKWAYTNAIPPWEWRAGKRP